MKIFYMYLIIQLTNIIMDYGRDVYETHKNLKIPQNLTKLYHITNRIFSTKYERMYVYYKRGKFINCILIYKVEINLDELS